jgi:hypothetical protein
MKIKIITIFVMTLLIMTALPAVGMMNENENSIKSKFNYRYLKQKTINTGFYRASWSEQAKLTASDGANNDYFGSANSIDGEYVISGAYMDDGMGSAYVFKRSGSTWSEHDKLMASDGVYADTFGGSVSISGDRVIIGACGDDDNGFYSGSAYVFKNSGSSWFEETKLLASDGVAGDYFGGSVSICAEYGIIGAPYDDDKGTDSGSAYIFIRSGNTWTEQAKLTALDGAIDDYFGFSVDIDGEYAIIGAPYDDDNGADSGSAYIFKRSGTTWSQEAKILASDGATEDYFGLRISISGEYIISGASRDDDFGSNSGSAYIFKRTGTTWAEEAKLLASDGASADFFGYTVGIDRDRAIIGAHGNGDLGTGSGSAYIFKRTGTSWAEEAKLLASDGASVDYFGTGVSIDGIYVISGAPYDDDNGAESGSTYIFQRSNQPPGIPTITGQTNGKVGTSYPYQFTSVDPDGDDIAEYIVNWGDGPDETVIGPFQSGSPATASHTWTSQGTYTIRTKAKDIYGAEGPEGTFTVTIPRDKAINNPFLNWLHSHPNLFPLLQKLIQQLGFGK